MAAEWSGVAVIGGFIINTLVLAVSFTWKLSRVATEIRDEIVRDKEAMREEIKAESRLIGETIHALRTKITEVEIWGRDNYVRRDSFRDVLDRISSDHQAWRAAMDERFTRFEAKLDRVSR